MVISAAVLLEQLFGFLSCGPLCTGTKQTCLVHVCVCVFTLSSLFLLTQPAMFSYRATFSKPARRPEAALFHPLQGSLWPEDILTRWQVHPENTSYLRAQRLMDKDRITESLSCWRFPCVCSLPDSPCWPSSVLYLSNRWLEDTYADIWWFYDDVLKPRSFIIKLTGTFSTYNIFEHEENPECPFFFLPVRFMLHLAEKTDGIIVTNDNLRDFVDTSDTWRRIIQERWLLCIQLSESFTYVRHYLTWHWKVHTGAMLRLKFYLKPFYLHLLSISESFIGKGTWEFMCVQETKRVQHC